MYMDYMDVLLTKMQTGFRSNLLGGKANRGSRASFAALPTSVLYSSGCP